MWEPCDNHAMGGGGGGGGGAYDHCKSLWISCDFLFQNDHENLLFSARSPCDHWAMPEQGSCEPPTTCLRATVLMYGLKIFDFYIIQRQNCRGYDIPMTPKKHTILYGLCSPGIKHQKSSSLHMTSLYPHDYVVVQPCLCRTWLETPKTGSPVWLFF